MGSNGLESLKKITKEKNKEKIIYILICAVVILIASTYIFKKEDNINKNIDNSQVSKENYIFELSNSEDKLANILNKIEGVSEVSCYINYKDEGSIVPSVNKDESVIFEEESGKKTVLIEKKLIPSVEGIIIVGKGMESEAIKAKIGTAVASVMNVEIFKVQIFNKGE